MRRKKRVPYQLFILILFLAIIILARPQPTGFAVFETQDFQIQAANNSADTTVPQQISVQGLLKGDTNLPVTDGVYNLTFNIYKAYSGGTSLYEERQESVNIRDGLFNVIIAPTLNFTDPFFLGVNVQAGGELTPRINLTSSPYAYRARYLSPNNFTIGYLINLSTTGDINMTGKISCNAIAGNGTGSLDTDFCTDSSGGGGGANPAVWINGTSKNIIINDTFGGGRINMSGDVVPDINDSKQVGNGSLLWLKGWFRDSLIYNLEAININISTTLDPNVNATANIGLNRQWLKGWFMNIFSRNIEAENINVTTLNVTNTIHTGGIYGLPYYYAQGLVAYWKFDETSGNRTDSGPLGIHLQENVTGAVGYVTTSAGAKFGNAASCSKQPPGSGTYLRAGEAESQNYTNFTGDFSACLWVRFNNTEGTQIIFAKDDRGTSPNKGYLYYNNLWLVQNGTASFGQTRVTIPGVNSTGFVCLVFDMTSLYSYVNGSLSDKKDVDGGGSSGIAYGKGNIGNFTVCGRNNGLLFDGIVDELSLWDRVISPTFVKWLWNDGNGRELDKP